MPVLLPPEEAANWLCESAERLIAARGAIVMALDGQAAAGKTTLAAAVASRVPGAFVVHMDDFFLPPEKRTPEYAARTLANADIERFSEEVLLPLAAGGPVSYRPYRFHPTPCFLSAVHLPGDRRLVVVEGAYCLHPALFSHYDLRALMTVSPETQRQRILLRNGEAMLARFLSEWIPKENQHIGTRRLAQRCDAVIAVP